MELLFFNFQLLEDDRWMVVKIFINNEAGQLKRHLNKNE